MAGVAQVFDVGRATVTAEILLYPHGRGAAGQHFADRFDLDGAQIASLQQVRLAAVGGEQIFQRSGMVGTLYNSHVSTGFILD